AFAEAYTQKVVFNVPYDIEGGVQIGAQSYEKGNPDTLAKAKEIFMQEAKAVVDEMISQDVKDAFEKGEVKQIVALIAYMNSLGQSRRAATQLSQAAQ
ncbi:cbb3-type cytochrome c oxidase subunit II, partial [Helicobacter japonicus]